MAEKDAYALACIGLFSRLWDELERLCMARAQIGLRSQIVRLEIHLALQSCETWRWRLLLNASQRLALVQTLRDVEHHLGASGAEISAPAAGAAQDRLLDAVLNHCAAWRPAAAEAQIERILVLPAGASGAMLHERDGQGSDAGSGRGSWAARQSSRDRQDLR
jgi:hypothetical protein